MLFWQKKSQLFFLSILLLAAFFVVEIKKVEAAFDPAVTYSKTSNGQLSADEWNNLQNDFVRAWGSTTAVGGIGIGIAPQGTDFNGLVASSTIKANGGFLGSLAATDIAMGDFGLHYSGGGGIWGFPTGRLGVSYSAGQMIPGTATFAVNGNVGIGTVNPNNSRLQLTGSDTYDSIFRLTNTGTSGGDYFMGVTNSGWTTGGNKLIFGVGTPSSANVKMLMGANGNVGIGTTNPQFRISTGAGDTIGTTILRFATGSYLDNANYGFEVYGFNNGANGHDLRFRGRATATGTFSDLLTIKNTGNVGIGTTAPIEKLHVVGNNYTTGYQQTRGATYTGAGLWFGDTQAVGIYKSTSDIRFKSTSDLMTIAASGNVGIGTTTPQYKLDVAGEGNFNGNYIHGVRGPVLGTDAANRSYVDTLMASTSAGIITQIATSSLWQGSLTGAIYNNNTGNVGIGTTAPSSPLTVSASSTGIVGRFSQLGAWTGSNYALYVDDGDYSYLSGFRIETPGGLRSLFAPGGQAIGFATAGDSAITFTQSTSVERMRIAAGGNLGIGTTTPGSLLTVGNNLGLTVLGTIYGATSTRYLDLSGVLPNALSAPGDIYSTAGVLKADGAGNSYVMGKLGVRTSNPGGNLSVDVGSSSDMRVNGLLVEESGAKVASIGDGGASGAQYGYLGLYSTGDVERVRLYAYGNNWIAPSNGNVGIGTTNPEAKLHLRGEPNFKQTITRASGGFAFSMNDLEIDNANGKLTLFRQGVYGSADTPSMGYFFMGADSDTTYSNNAFRIYPGKIANFQGNVGIGTAAPQYKLDVAGEANFNGNQIHGVAAPVQGTDAANKSYVDSSITPPATTTAGIQAGFWTTGAGGSIYNNNSSGLVGIGTTNPGSKLTVSGPNDKDTGPILNLSGSSVNQLESGRVRFTETTVAAAPFYQGAFFHYDGSANTFNIGVHETADALQASDINSIRITRSNGSVNIGNGALFTQYNGNVGVGINNPDYPLTIKYSANGQIGLRRSDGNTVGLLGVDSSNVFNIQSTSGSGNIAIKQNVGGSGQLTTLFLKGSNGNVGIGTTAPGYKLDVAGEANFGGNQIHGVAAPTQGTDAVNRNYVDSNFIASTSLSTNAFVQGGNSFGTKAILGTNDNQALGLETNGTEKMTILANGNVGIRTTAPDSSLSVKSAGNAVTNIYGVSAALDYGAIQVSNVGGLTNPSNRPLVLQPNAGKVGIGVTNPGAKLDVAGSFRSTSATISLLGNSGDRIVMTDNSGNLYATSTSVATGLPSPSGISGQTLRSNGTNWIANNVLYNNGTNIGIGNASPGARLDITGTEAHVSGDLGGTDALLRLYNDLDSDVAEKGAVITFEDKYLGTTRTTRAAIKGGTARAGNTADGFLSFYTDSGSANTMQERMRIIQNGNVGIGTTAPAQKLEVAGNIFMNTGYLMQTDTWGMKWKFAGDSDTVEMNSSELAWKFNIAGGGVTKYRFNSSKTGFGPILDLNTSGSSIFYGNVGIGTTTPGYKLDLAGDLNSNTYQIHGLGAPTTGTDAVNRNYVDTLISDSVSATDFWKLNGSNLYASSTSWNVGIGTTAPASKLHVAGSWASTILTGDNIIVKKPDFPSGGGWARTLLSFQENDGTSYFQIGALGNNNTFSNGYLGAAWDNTTMRWYSNKNVVFDGSVGVGTTVPKNKLSVTATSASSVPALGASGQIFGVLSDSSNYGLVAGVLGSGNTYLQSQRVDGTATAYNILLQPNGGNVGIGTTAPAQKLHVAGDASFMVGTSSPSQIHYVAAPTQGTDAVNRNYVDTLINDSVSAAQYWKLNGSNLYASSTSWKVGIGTTAPYAGLDIANTGIIGSAGYAYGLLLKPSNTGLGARFAFTSGTNPEGSRKVVLMGESSQNLGDFTVLTSADANLPAGTGTFVNRFIIQNSGNVGISSSSPSSLLSISNNLGLTAGGTIYNSDSTRWLDMTGAKLDSIKVPGNILTTGGMLVSDLYNAAQIRLNSAGSNFGKIQSDAANTWSLAYSTASSSALGTPALSWNSAGNVGIGTTNPADKLQVTGGNVLISNATITTSTPKAAITKEYLDANTWAKYGDGVATKYATDEDILSAVLEPNLNTNKLWFYDTSLFLFEGSNDGINYTPYTVSVTQLEKILANYNPEAVSLSLGGAYKYYRITITGNTNRVALETLQMKMITVSKPINVFLERFRNSSNTWETFVNTTWAGGYPDTMTIKHSSFQLHPTWTGGKGSSKVRITLSFVDGTTNNISINSLRWYGYFSYVDDIANRRSVYTWDYDKNVAFPASIFVAGNIGIGTTTPSTKLYVNGVVTATGGFSGPLTGTVNAANISKGIFGTNTGQGTYSFGGVTANGDSHYQWEGATYRNPGDYTPQINIRQDNATTGINGFKPALTLYNQNGDLNSTIGLDFSVRETTAAGNATALAGIMAIKESAGTSGAWTQGGLLFYTKNMGTRVDALRILNNGNVGIGVDPGIFKLKVAGNVAITGTLQTMTGSDFAEEFTVSSPLEAGTVVVMGDLGYKSVKACGEKFDSTVVGVVSDNPSIIAGRVDSKHKVVVAMAGVVKVKVSNANGNIKKGTMLTTSNISGYAMKADNAHPGTIIGKALENLTNKQGEIKVLINLQ